MVFRFFIPHMLVWIQYNLATTIVVTTWLYQQEVAAWTMMMQPPPISHHRQQGGRSFVLFSEKSDEGGVSRAKELPQILKFRGTVDEGYGRGGKKLGVPTANLPASLFQNALEEVSTGVYFGWTALERDDPPTTYKSVVNVGYSPTFEGKENPEKIIEAHLILEDDDELPDFYGVPMRLQLIGFLRDEKKFDSFPDLIAQIHADIQDAKDSLDVDPYKQYQEDDFFSKSSWIGSSGGDGTASWEFAPN